MAGNIGEEAVEEIRLDLQAPDIDILNPAAREYEPEAQITIGWQVADSNSEVEGVSARLDEKDVENGQTIDFQTLSLGKHLLTVIAKDVTGNLNTATVEFTIGSDRADIHKLIMDLD